MKKIRSIMVMVLSIVLLLATTASANLLVPGTENDLYYNNFELLFDAQGNQVDIVNNFQRGVLPGDYFMGIMAVQNIDSDGGTHWFQSGTDQLTGIFVQKVINLSLPGTPDLQTGVLNQDAHIQLGNTDKLNFTLLDNTTVDLTGVIQAGEMFALYHDTAVGGMTVFQSNGTIQDDIGRATDSDTNDVWMSFGLMEPTDYAYSHVNLFVPGIQLDGRAFLGLSVMRNNSGIPDWIGIDDIDEFEFNTLAQLISSSEFEQNRDYPTTSPWVFQSNDPATLYPVPEPSTFVLLAAGVIGLGVIARRRRQ